MNLSLRSLGGFFLMCFVAAAASAQTPQQRAECERDFAPQSGQAGKDVIWVPTPDQLVTAMLKAANTSANDIVYDLGAGDGKIAIAAAKEFGARSVGIEYDPKMAKLATCLATAAGVTDKVRIVQGDIYKTDFSEATVVTLYLLPTLNERLIPTLLKMKPGTRIVSHSFLMGDWRPDQHIVMDGYDHAYQWIVPAQVAGTWDFRAAGNENLEVRLKQTYQALEGVVIEAGQSLAIQDATVRGHDIEFTYVGPMGAKTFKAKIGADKTVATVSDGQKTTQYSSDRK
jgi:SAM-dependent methyltransferase